MVNYCGGPCSCCSNLVAPLLPMQLYGHICAGQLLAVELLLIPLSLLLLLLSILLPMQLCGHLGAGQLLAVELLLTPDSENDFLSEAALMEVSSTN